MADLQYGFRRLNMTFVFRGTQHFNYVITDYPAGGNPNALDKDSLTCLTRAAEQPELVRLRVEYGAS